MRRTIIAVSVAALLVGGTATISEAAGTQSVNVTSNRVARMVGDGRTNNKEALQAILNTAPRYRHTTIHVPAGDYALSGFVQMRSNTTITFAPGAKFSSLGYLRFEYPSSGAGYSSGVSNVTWNSPYFDGRNGTTVVSGSMIHARNITYHNPTWNQALGAGDHLLDIMGSSQISIQKPQVLGTTHAYTQKRQFYKEAFQISYASKWSTDPNRPVPAAALDNLPSHHVEVVGGLFTATYNRAGEILTYAPNPVGEHGDQAGQQIHAISFRGNTVRDPAPASETTFARGAVHFMSVSNLVIADNTFEYRKAPDRDCVISLEAFASTSNTLPTRQVRIESNTFRNVHPKTGYVHALSYLKNGSRNTINDLSVTGNRAVAGSSNRPFVATSGRENIHGLVERDNSWSR